MAPGWRLLAAGLRPVTAMNSTFARLSASSAVQYAVRLYSCLRKSYERGARACKGGNTWRRLWRVDTSSIIWEP